PGSQPPSDLPADGSVHASAEGPGAIVALLTATGGARPLAESGLLALSVSVSEPDAEGRPFDCYPHARAPLSEARVPLHRRPRRGRTRAARGPGRVGGGGARHQARAQGPRRFQSVDRGTARNPF